MSSAREPEEIYRAARDEGRRRLSRPVTELAATAFIGGFDVSVGILAYALAASSVGAGGTGHLVGAIAFGIGFVFIVVGRSELFTENFLIPVAGLDRSSRRAWGKLLELWSVALVLNIVGGVLLILILTSEGVTHQGIKAPIVEITDHITGLSSLGSFLSAVVAGGLMTVMTWFVEGAAESAVVRIVMAWITGAVIALGLFNHAIVSTLELVYGMRLGVHVEVRQLLENLGLAVAGNLVGGLLLVTFVRSVQAAEAAR